MREAFALPKLLMIFQQKKYWHILDINFRNFNEMLTNNVISFEQLGPGHVNSTYQSMYVQYFNLLYLLLIYDLLYTVVVTFVLIGHVHNLVNL